VVGASTTQGTTGTTIIPDAAGSSPIAAEQTVSNPTLAEAGTQGPSSLIGSSIMPTGTPADNLAAASSIQTGAPIDALIPTLALPIPVSTMIPTGTPGVPEAAAAMVPPITTGPPVTGVTLPAQVMGVDPLAAPATTPTDTPTLAGLALPVSTLPVVGTTQPLTTTGVTTTPAIPAPLGDLVSVVEPVTVAALQGIQTSM
jgi:hypothetical protein